MEYYETIVVGAGPAGSSCAWQLKRNKREVLVLDKQSFPRLKLCAGWITSKVMENLEFSPRDYPHSLLEMKTKMYIAPFPFPLGRWPTRWADYSIRRIEFDRWLLERSQAPVKTHKVKNIEKQGDLYVIDGKYQCKYLVGAGGTGCPVRRFFFPRQRDKEEKIVTLNQELKYPQRDDTAYIFFCEHGLKGYSWYIPKGDGYLNIGLGGFSSYFKRSKTNIHTHFQWFLENLIKRGLLDEHTAQKLKVQGYAYYLFRRRGGVKKNNCFLIGDSAGLATIDMGEGISPAIESGLLAAEEILGQRQYNQQAVSRLSLNPSFQWIQTIWSYIWCQS
ncbi:MAG: NAD(P)/FAD-dependent oxidoreductase [Synechococcus sp.]